MSATATRTSTRTSTALLKKDAAWVTRLFNRQTYPPEYQDLKFSLHKKLLTRINLEALAALPEEQMRNEIRGAVAKLVAEQDAPLNTSEKERIVNEVLDEVFGLGPSGAAAAGPDHLRHPGHDAPPRVYRARRPVIPDTGRI